jgi:DNA-directed RNA polymerase sigma subunit (sigma70/sigma32)
MKITEQERKYRKQLIIKMIKERYTYEEIGKILDISKQRVYLIVKNENLTPLRYAKRGRKINKNNN